MNTTLQYKLHSGKNSKAAYYMQAALRDMLPDRLYAMRLNRELERCAAMYDRDYIADRVDYYCKLSRPVTLGSDSEPIGALQRKGNPSTYYYDSREALQWFNPELRWHYLFGDIRDIPAEPTVVKSRALGTDNSNSVLLKLDRCRHFVYINDHLQPEEKEDRAIFRGHIGPGATEGHKHTSQMKPMMSFYEHLRFRYIMALEGNDVASNLKWIMSSRSAAVMPKPTCETWFMEGRLVGGVHYVEIRPDFSDLEEKMDHYSNHLDELRTIVDNANRYVAQFRDPRRERYIALLVMQKYFKMTNQ